MERTIGKALEIAKAFPQTLAFGVSGSFAQNKTDQYSDYDFCIFTDGVIPDPNQQPRSKLRGMLVPSGIVLYGERNGAELRGMYPKGNQKRDTYKKKGITEFDFFDVDFEISNGDGFSLDDHECGFIWMEYQRSLDLLDQLNTNWELNEYLPGGIERTIMLFESDNEIKTLKDRLRYADERSIGRFELFVNRAHFSMYTLKWLEKAAFRNDYYSFHKNSFEAIEYLVYALYALNKKWMADEKRILQLAGGLTWTPKDLESRLRDIILHTNGNNDLYRCYLNIKALFIEAMGIFSEIHGHEPVRKLWN